MSNKVNINEKGQSKTWRQDTGMAATIYVYLSSYY